MTASSDVVTLSNDSFAVLALESWRLSRIIDNTNPHSMHLQYSINKIRECLESEGCTYIDLTGQKYDSGMAVDVIDVELDSNQSSSLTLIKEVITPIILWKKDVIHHGQVIVRKGTLNEKKSHE